MSDKTVPVYVRETPLEDTLIHIFKRNGIWMADAVEAGRIMSRIKTTDPSIKRFTVYEDKVVFTDNN
jgi:hypothetical protein